MKRRFTKLIAALALLVTLAIPLGMWGQTKSEGDTHDFPQTLQAQLNNNASINPINIVEQSYPVKKVTVSYRYNKDITNAVTIEVTVGGTSWGTESVTNTGQNYATLDFEGTSTTGAIVVSFTNNTGSGTGHGTLWVNNVRLTEGSSGGGGSTGSITLDSYSVSVDYNEYYKEVGLSYEGITSPEFDLAYYESDGTTSATYSWMEDSYVAYDYQSSGYKVYCIFDGNDGGTRYAYFKVYSGTVESNLVTVTQGANPGTPTTTTIEPNSGFDNDLNHNPNGGQLVATVTANSQTIQDPEVTWASSNTSVATVNQYGVVTLVAVGQTDITATYAGDNTYAGSVGTYQLNVINSAPWATATPGTLNNFSYNEGYGPSAVQTISVEGDNLASNVLVELDGLSGSSFEISLDGTNWNANGSISLTPTNGTLAATTISVRMKAGLVTGASYSDQLRVKYNGSNKASINLSGSVNTITIMSVAEARAAIAQGAPYPTGVFVSGIVTRRYNNTLNSGKLSYYISDDGEQNNELEAYKGLGLNGEEFTSYHDIEAGDIVVVYGDLTKYNNTYELDEGNYLYSWRRPATLTVSNLSNVETFVYNAADQNTPLIEGEGSYVFDAGDEVMISVSAESGYILSTFTVNGVDHLNDIVADAYTFTINQNTTVTATAVQAYNINYSVNGVLTQAQVPGNFQLPTSANLNSDEFVFAGWTTNPNVVTGFSTAGTTVNVQGDETFYAVYGKTTADGPATTVYQKVTSEPSSWEGEYLIVSTGTSGNHSFSVAFDGSKTSSSNLEAVGNYISNVVINNDQIESTQALDAATFTIAAVTGGYSIQSKSGLYIGRTANSNGINISSTDPMANTISMSPSLQIIGTGNAKLQFFANSGSERFRYYTSSQKAIQLFKKTTIASTTTTYYTRVFLGDHLNFGHLQYDATSDIEIVGPSIVPSNHVLSMGFYALSNDVAANLIIEDGGQVSSMNEDGGKVFAGTMLKNITACDYNPSNNAGYYLIATPIEGFVPTANNGFITTDYDLYDYDATKEDEWVNFKQTGNFSTLLGYHGYLYASGQNTTLRFEGLLNDPSMNDYVGGSYVELNYAGGDDAMKDLTLVGNSGTAETTFSMYDDSGNQVMSFNFLTLNDTGDGFISNVDEEMVEVAPLDAVFVQAPGAYHYMSNDDQILSFSANNRNVNVKVSRKNGDLLDNAIVSFGGSMMKKLYLTDNSTRVYFPISNQDYAVVRVQSEGDQPVNFKAKENGTYTLNIETKNIEMEYLHLIDNMTGADVDLLTTPSYTFEAKTSDYASRFRLVFNANNTDEDGASTGSATFAYFNGSSWTVSNMGEATLQVVDVMGRVLSSETLSGNAEVNINQPTGVYMLRLVSGDSVKVQKVVVR